MSHVSGARDTAARKKSLTYSAKFIARGRFHEKINISTNEKQLLILAETGTEEETTQTENANPLLYSLATLAAVAENLVIKSETLLYSMYL